MENDTVYMVEFPIDGKSMFQKLANTTKKTFCNPFFHLFLQQKVEEFYRKENIIWDDKKNSRFSFNSRWWNKIKSPNNNAKNLKKSRQKHLETQ